MMMKTLMKAAILGFMPLLAVTGISAQVVNVEDKKITLNVSAEPDQEGEAMETDSFKVYAQTGDDMLLVRVGDTDGYVKKDELQALLPELDCDAYPLLDDVTAVKPEDDAELVTSLQKDLRKLGLLDGEADGIYGSGTAEAVRKFQAQHGLAETGQADLYTMLVLAGAVEGLEDSVDLTTKKYDSAEDKFPEIFEKTDADLEPFMDASWKYQFDQIKESGVIDPQISFGIFDVASPEVDRIFGEVSAKVIIEKAGNDSYRLIPVLAVDTEGSHRLYLQGMALKGDDTVRLENGFSSGELEGVTLKESGYVPLTSEAMKLLNSGDLETIRVLGKNESFDVECEYDSEKLTAFVEACEALVQE